MFMQLYAYVTYLELKKELEKKIEELKKVETELGGKSPVATQSEFHFSTPRLFTVRAS